MRPVLRGFGLLLILFIAITIVRTLSFGHVALPAASDEPSPVVVPPELVLGRLSAAIQLRTVSNQVNVWQEDAEQWIREEHPILEDSLGFEVVGKGLLLTWNSQDTGSTKPDPALFLSHFDVVPAGDLDSWQSLPFSGDVEEDFVWGRGSLDDKSAVVALLSSLESLIAEGRSPSRDVYIYIGFDEETGGNEGAAVLAERLRRDAVQLSVVYDEGLAITDGILRGIDQNVALIGVAEKGVYELRLTVSNRSPGHAALPESTNAITDLSELVTLIRDNPMDPHAEGLTASLLDQLGPNMSFPRRYLMANRWLFEPLIVRSLTQEASTNALLRTTITPTVIDAGSASNVIPQSALVVLNVRVHPLDTIEDVEAHLRSLLSGFEITTASVGFPPSPVSSAETSEYELLEMAIHQTLEGQEVLVSPSLLMGSTDSKHFFDLSPSIYRFRPYVFTSDDLDLIHRDCNQRE